MASSRQRAREFRESLLAITQAIFAFLVIFIFFLAFIIQSKAITIPQWGKTFQGVAPEDQGPMAAALLTIVIVLSDSSVEWLEATKEIKARLESDLSIASDTAKGV
ncbi:hypothetical protein F5Y18DRAFT_431919 [Xylariaceae sp. FL1019]|nr:hypothetical protein F5Y18DRAFT_431919 [Xylariaceae sp. FL1019]